MTRVPGPDWGATTAGSTVERASRFARSVACAVTVGLVALMLAAATPAGAAVDPLNPSSWACGSEDLGLGDDRVELAPVSPDEREADGGPIVPRATPSGAWVPVVMVHGWTARSTHPNADGTEDTQGTFSHLIDFTANRSGSADVGRSLVGQLQGLPGAAVFTFDYHPYSGRWVTDEHLGPALVKVVDCLAKASGQKVIVVGHSMGGLVGRFAATDGGRGSDSIAQLVTMGTPNQGSLAAMVTAVAADVGAVVDRRLAVLRLLLAECGRVTSSSMDGASLCHMLPAFVTAFDGEAGKALRFGSQELKSLNARPVPSDITVNALAGSTLMSVPRMGWFGWSWETDTVDIGDVVVDHASATKPSSTIDDISCAYQMSPVRGLADTAGLVLKVRTLNEVGDVPWNLLSGPCFHNALPRSIELTNAVMALVREEIEGRPAAVTATPDSTSPPLSALEVGAFLMPLPPDYYFDPVSSGPLVGVAAGPDGSPDQNPNNPSQFRVLLGGATNSEGRYDTTWVPEECFLDPGSVSRVVEDRRITVAGHAGIMNQFRYSCEDVSYTWVYWEADLGSTAFRAEYIWTGPDRDVSELTSGLAEASWRPDL
jgi:pimeloyl-ACP methyl ester carboxylesterase